MIKLVHKQVLKELAVNFSLTVGALLGLILIGRLLQMRDVFLSQNVGVLEMLALFVYLSPFFLLLVTPIASMLSVFLTFLRMSTDKELTALRAGGISLYQLLPAPLIFSLCCALLAFVVAFWGLSWGMDQFRATIMEYARTRTQLALQPGIFNRDFPGLTLYAHQVDPESGDLKFVFVQDKTRDDTTVNIVAPVGRVHTDSDNGRIVIGFENGQIYRRDGSRLDVLRFGEYTVNLPLRKILGNVGFGGEKANEMSWSGLHDKLRELEPRMEGNKYLTNFYNKVLVEIQKRLAMPVGCFVLGMFAMPIGCVFRGLKQQYGLILSMGLFLVYYTMFSIGVSLGETGRLDPRIGLWVPNVLFAGVAAYGLRLAYREKNMQLVAWVSHLRLRWRSQE